MSSNNAKVVKKSHTSKYRDASPFIYPYRCEVPIEEISKWMPKAVMGTEDGRYMSVIAFEGSSEEGS